MLNPRYYAGVISIRTGSPARRSSRRCTKSRRRLPSRRSDCDTAARRFASPQAAAIDSNPSHEQVRLDTYLSIVPWGADDGVTMTDLSRCEAARYAINSVDSNRPFRSGRATPHRPARAVRRQIKVRAGSDQSTAGTGSRNLPGTIITLLCAPALVVLAVIITMLPFVLL